MSFDIEWAMPKLVHYYQPAWHVKKHSTRPAMHCSTLLIVMDRMCPFFVAGFVMLEIFADEAESYRIKCKDKVADDLKKILKSGGNARPWFSIKVKHDKKWMK